MRIFTNKIPLKFKNLPELAEFINLDQDKLLKLVIAELRKMNGKSDSSNATYNQIADIFNSFTLSTIIFNFYTSRNPFIGHKVISHATHDNTINYNTRFHSASTFTLNDWIRNFFHELTHCADYRSSYSFSHDDQKDLGAAPFVIGDLAERLFKENYKELL